MTKEQQESINILRADVWGKTGGICWYCGESINPFKSRAFAIDHLIPRSKGGSDELANLVPSCGSCNSMKGNCTIDQFRQRLCGAAKLKPDQIEVLKCLGYSDVEEKIQSFTNGFKFWFERSVK